MFDTWVLDVSSPIAGPYCFCPVEGEDVIVGMNVIADKPPRDGRCVGVFSQEGQEYVDKVWPEWEPILKRIQGRS